MKKLFIVTAAVFAGLNLSGCMLVMAGGGYHPDHGDLVSGDGSIRYVAWCDVHRHSSYCRNAAPAAALPVVVAASTDLESEVE